MYNALCQHFDAKQFGRSAKLRETKAKRSPAGRFSFGGTCTVFLPFQWIPRISSVNPMIRNTRALFPRIKHFQRKYSPFSILGGQKLSFSSQQTVEGEPRVIDLINPELFDAQKTHNPHCLREGSFVNLSSADLDHFIPEGLGGEMAEDLVVTKNSAWMIRDPSKLLFRFIETFDKLETKNRVDGSSAPEVNELPPAHLLGVTDKPEWESCKLRVRYYGANVNTAAKTSSDVLPTGSSVSARIENTLASITSMSGGTIPTKIMLTG